MTEYASVQGGVISAYPVGLQDISAAHPRKSLPSPLTANDLAPLGFAVVEKYPLPALAPGEFVTFGEPEEQAPGLWVRQAVVSPATPTQFDAQEHRLHEKIDTDCGEFRRRFITDVPGQAQTYEAKKTEASAYLSNPNGTYPFLTAEAQATGRTVAEVATEVATLAAQWVFLGSAIEGLRIASKRAVSLHKEAGDWAAMDAAADVQWETLLA